MYVHIYLPTYLRLDSYNVLRNPFIPTYRVCTNQTGQRRLPTINIVGYSVLDIYVGMKCLNFVKKLAILILRFNVDK
jgi:hypothetical protein